MLDSARTVFVNSTACSVLSPSRPSVRSHSRPSSPQLDVQVPEEPIGVNVVGVLPGRRWGSPEDKLLIVGAHYDTVAETPGERRGGGQLCGLRRLRLRLRTILLSATAALSGSPDAVMGSLNCLSVRGVAVGL